MGRLAEIFGGIIFAVFKFCFPDKTAAGQRADDRESTVREANDAIKNNEKVAQEPLVDVQSYLDKRVR